LTRNVDIISLEGDSMNAYQAYYENGRIIPMGNPVIPEGRKMIITVLDEEETSDRISRRLDALEKFKSEILASDESLGPEFDEIVSHRVNIARDVDL
jgi:predicted DNA-binding antitoxin AbrB/MazE fold protein